MTYKSKTLTPHALAIIKNKATEHPFSGMYNDFGETGTYLCRQCGLALFRSQTKFHSGCGWPSFDDALPEAVATLADPDGRRTEIICARCKGHLGHVFTNEGFTAKNIRHCVNSLSLDFIADPTVKDTEEALFAGGCFWGIEHLFKKLPGVLKTEVGYSGGKKEYPTYEEICQGTTGHYEAIRIIYNPLIVSYEQLVKYFFEIHDPTQANGQGPDIGEQYLSVIFYYDEKQLHHAEPIIADLKKRSYAVKTLLLPATIFWRAEEYHQQYYEKTGKNPYCHFYTKRF